MKTYFTGTTVECLEQILKDGVIKTCPPHRVWKEYSSSYVYTIPTEQKWEERETLFTFAMEQAGFAVAALNGNRRVVLELKGIQEDLLEKDPDASGIYALRYPKDISISHIKSIFVESADNSQEIKELIAITFYLRTKYDSHKIYNLYQDLCGIEEEIYAEIPVKHIECVGLDYLLDDSALENRYHELREELDLEYEVDEYSVSEYLEAHSFVAA